MSAGGPARPRRGDRVLGCRLDERLSTRDGASVWRAWRPSEARDVAVKVLHRDQVNDLTVRHLRRSGQVLRALDPPYGAAVLETGEVDDHVVLVSRLVPGVDLGRRVRRDGWWTPRRSVATVRQIAACLDAVHRAGIVHGALNPRNVRLSGAGAGETVGVVDLGLPRSVEGLEHDPYRAPELRRSDIAVAASDVYGVSALLHLMLTGTAPGLPAVAPVPAHDERGRLLALAAHGLSASPSQRPSSVQALADAAVLALDEGDEEPSHDWTPRVPAGSVLTAGGDGPAAVAPTPRRIVPVVVPFPAQEVGAPERRTRRAWVSEEERASREAARSGRSHRLAGLAALVALTLAVQVGGLVWAASGSGEEAPVVYATNVGSEPATPGDEGGGDEQQPSRALEGSSDDWGTLRPGVQAPAVRAVQLLLVAHGRDVVPDGVYDADLAQRLRDFQVAKDVPPTGLVDPQTWQVLAAPAVPGDEGPEVRALQQLLKVSARVDVDGSYDRATARAVAAFQRANGLDTSGTADAATWQALSRAWA